MTKTDRTAAELDRRRNTLQKRQSAAQETSREVAELEKALEHNAVQTSEHEAELRSAQDRVAVLKKTIKATKKDREKLRDARKKARNRDAEARQRAAAVEAKYDKAVLADMLRREKERDLAVNGGVTGVVVTTTEAPVAKAPAKAVATAPTAAPAKPADTAPAKPAETAPATTGQTARRTQARRTASRAAGTKPTTAE